MVEARDDWWHRKYTEDAEGRLVKLPSGGADDADEPRSATVAATTAPRPPTPTWRSPTPAASRTPAETDDHTDGHGIHMPSPSYYPLVLALGLPCLGYAAVFTRSSG